MKEASAFDFWYAVRNTHVLAAPRRHLETFGNTLVNYHLLAEPMDAVGKVKVRTGRMQMFKPQLLMPSAYAKTELEGFGEEAEKYLEWLKENEQDVRVLRYGYTLKQEAFSEEVVTDSMEAVSERVVKAVAAGGDAFAAVVAGVDEPWDVCLVRLFWLMVQNSSGPNIMEMAKQRMFELQEGIPVPVRREIEVAFAAASRDRALVPALGKLLKQHDVFEQFEDRFFKLVAQV